MPALSPAAIADGILAIDRHLATHPITAAEWTTALEEVEQQRDQIRAKARAYLVALDALPVAENSADHEQRFATAKRALEELRREAEHA